MAEFKGTKGRVELTECAGMLFVGSETLSEPIVTFDTYSEKDEADAKFIVDA